MVWALARFYSERTSQVLVRICSWSENKTYCFACPARTRKATTRVCITGKWLADSTCKFFHWFFIELFHVDLFFELNIIKNWTKNYTSNRPGITGNRNKLPCRFHGEVCGGNFNGVPGKIRNAAKIFRVKEWPAFASAQKINSLSTCKGVIHYLNRNGQSG